MSRSFVCVSLLVFVTLIAAPALGSTLTYNFDGADSPGTWAPLPGYPGDSNVTLQVVTYDGTTGTGYGPYSSPNYVIGRPVFNYSSAHATATFASPTFKLDLSGGDDLTFWINTGNTSTLEGRTIAGYSVQPGSGGTPLSNLPANTADTGGFYGVALLDVTSSTIVMGGTNDRALDWRNSPTGSWNSRLTSGFSRLGDGWWQLRFRNSDLTPLNQSDIYQVVFIDQAGLNQWGEFDSVSIPGTLASIPEPGTLALLAAGLVGLLCYAWRKRR